MAGRSVSSLTTIPVSNRSREGSMSNTVLFTSGNTYQKIPANRAKLDRSRRFQKIHDVTIFIDVLEGNPDLVQRVTFDLGVSFQPRAFSCACPIRVRRHDGRTAWRFSTRQQVYGSTMANISLLGAGGSKSQVSHKIVLGDQAFVVGDIHRFVETCPGKPLPLLKMDPDQQFGIELELTSPANTTVEKIASDLTRKTKGRFGRITVIRNYADAHDTTEVWKMVPDSSIACSRNNPTCTKFELVSPIIVGGSGLNQASQVLDALKHIELQVNKSMGFHVHVNVSSLNLQQIIKVCQNATKYEDVIDALVPPSRRTGSEECNRFFKSNRQAMQEAGYTTNKQRNDALAACGSMEELAELMNPNGSRYHKINLQNLVTGRQPTIEFRQHSATSNSRKVNSWVRFCITLVNNSARLAAPKAFREGRDLDFQFDALFQFVVKDRALRTYYRGRKDDLSSGGDEEEACCSSCAAGGRCNAAHQNRNLFLPGKAY